MIDDVRHSLEFQRTSGFARPGRQKLEGILKQHGIPLADVHFRQAEAIYMRGMAAALLNTERRWSGVREDDLALVQAALAAPVIPEPRVAQHTTSLTLPSRQVSAERPLAATIPPVQSSEHSIPPRRAFSILMTGASLNPDHGEFFPACLALHSSMSWKALPLRTGLAFLQTPFAKINVFPRYFR